MVKNNGWLSEYIAITRSVKQGCPVSALLIIICIEMLSRKINNELQRNGIKINTLIDTNSQSEFRTMQYADDIILILNDKLSLQRALDIIKQFSDSAGPKLNLEKSEIVGNGRFKKWNEICGIKVSEYTRCLGIYVGHNTEKCNQQNWDEKIKKLDIILKSWSKRHLTMFGKIIVVKCIISMYTLHTNFGLCLL